MIRKESSSSVNHANATRAIRGARYIAYARSATHDGAEIKLDRQIHAIRQFADRLGMRCVGEVRLAGVSGGRPALRADLLKLLARKREQNDFEVLVMEDFSRLVRAQSPQDLTVKDEFAKRGVRIVFVQDYEQIAHEGAAS